MSIISYAWKKCTYFGTYWTTYSPILIYLWKANSQSLVLNTECTVYLRDGLIDIHPACQGVDPEVLRLFTRHRVCDGCIGAKVIVVSRHPQETSPQHGILTEEVYKGRERNRCASLRCGICQFFFRFNSHLLSTYTRIVCSQTWGCCRSGPVWVCWADKCLSAGRLPGRWPSLSPRTPAGVRGQISWLSQLLLETTEITRLIKQLNHAECSSVSCPQRHLQFNTKKISSASELNFKDRGAERKRKWEFFKSDFHQIQREWLF